MTKASIQRSNTYELEKHVECIYYIYTCVQEYTYSSSVGGYDGG